MCVGDPFVDEIGECRCAPVAFCFAAMRGLDQRVRVTAIPFCDHHQHLVLDWVASDVVAPFDVMPIGWLDKVRERAAQEGTELFVLLRGAAA